MFTAPTMEIVYDPEASTDAPAKVSVPKSHDQGKGSYKRKGQDGNGWRSEKKQVVLKPGPKSVAKESGKKPWWLLRREGWKAQGETGKPKKQNYHKKGKQKY